MYRMTVHNKFKNNQNCVCLKLHWNNSIFIFYVQLEYIYLATSKTKKDLQKVSTSQKSPHILLFVSCSPDVHLATGNVYIYTIRSIYMGIKILNNSLSE